MAHREIDYFSFEPTKTAASVTTTPSSPSSDIGVPTTAVSTTDCNFTKNPNSETDGNVFIVSDDNNPSPKSGVVSRVKSHIHRKLRHSVRHQHYPQRHFYHRHPRCYRDDNTSPHPPKRLPKPSDNIFIRGRRYQSYNNRYFLPNDDIEMDRLLNNHFLGKYYFGANYSAPVTELLSEPNTHTFDTSSCFPTHEPFSPTRTPPRSEANTPSESAELPSPANETCTSSSPTTSPPFSQGGVSTLSSYLRKFANTLSKQPAQRPFSEKRKEQHPLSPTKSTEEETLATNPTTYGTRRYHSERNTKQNRRAEQLITSYSTPTGLCIDHPLSNITRALDVACGSGVWLLEMAHEFPNTEFYGFDLSEVFPTAIHPKNTCFTLYDMIDGFPYPDCFFDYIRMHDVATCFPSSDTKSVMQEIRRCLKPGGYIELREVDPIVLDAGPITSKFTSADSLIVKGLQRRYNLDISWASEIWKHLRRADFVEIHRSTVPLIYDEDTLPKRACIDQMCQRFWKDRLYAYHHVFSEILENQLTAEELDDEIELMIKEIKEHSSYCQYHMAWGRKSLLDKCDDSNENYAIDDTISDCPDNANDKKDSQDNDDKNIDTRQSFTARPLSSTSSQWSANAASIKDIDQSSFSYEIYDFTDGYTD